MRLPLFSIIFLLLFSNLSSGAKYELNPGEVLITDFEGTLNRLRGSINVFGAIEGSGYTREFAYSGKQSYKIVFVKDFIWKYFDEGDNRLTGTGMKEIKKTAKIGKSQKIIWGLFMMAMGPVGDTSRIPATVEPFDVSGFKHLIFWVKGRRGNEQFKIYFNDIHAKTYDPQLKIKPKVRVSSKEWRKVTVNLQRLKKKIDLKKMTKIGIGFGASDGGRPGNVFYVDNFILVK